MHLPMITENTHTPTLFKNIYLTGPHPSRSTHNKVLNTKNVALCREKIYF